MNEHGSPAVVNEHRSPVKERNVNLETDKEIILATLNQCQEEKAVLEMKVSELQALLENANNEIKNLENAQKALLDQSPLQNRIRQLESLNAKLEHQLKRKIFGV